MPGWRNWYPRSLEVAVVRKAVEVQVLSRAPE